MQKLESAAYIGSASASEVIVNFQTELQFFMEYLGEQISSPFGDLPDDRRQREMKKPKRKSPRMQRWQNRINPARSKRPVLITHQRNP